MAAMIPGASPGCRRYLSPAAVWTAVAMSPVVRVSRSMMLPLSDDRPPRQAAGAHWVLLAAVLPWLVIGVGVWGRVYQWGMAKSLWLDELFLWVNLEDRGFWGLTAPLEWRQATPLLFLWVTEMITLVFGDGERPLRLLPMLASVASLPLTWAVARRVLPRGPAVVALALVAMNPWAIYYAAELKQYAVELCVAVLLLWLGLRAMPRRAKRDIWPQTTAAKTDSGLSWVWIGGGVRPGEGSGKGVWPLLVAGVVLVWASISATLVLFGVGLGLIAASLAARRWRDAGVWVGVSAAWVASFTVQYATMLYRHTKTDYPRSYFEQYFNGRGAYPDSAGYAWELFVRAFENPGAFGRFTEAAAAFMLIGIVALAVRSLPTAIMCAAPFVALLLGAALKTYPLADRLLLFAVPHAAVLVVCGVQGVVALAAAAVALLRGAHPSWRHPSVYRVLATTAAAALLATPVVDAGWVWCHTVFKREDHRALFAWGQGAGAAGGHVYVHGWATLAWRYYADRYEMPDGGVIVGGESAIGSEWALRRELEALPAGRCVVLLSHAGWDGVPTQEVVTEELGSRGELADRFAGPGVEGRLYVLER